MLLRGLKVIDFATYIAGPGAAGILGDWGADVIKVERPGGDQMRHTFADRPEISGNPTFDMDNRGKRTVALDIGKPQGRDALARLAGAADVFVTNVRPAALRRARLDDASLREANPRLVYAMITGYGVEGPDAHKPGFDITAFWARAGVASMTAPKGVDPFMIRSGFGDHITAMATVSAILAGLYERSQTGQGRVVLTSLMATGVYAMGSDMAVQLKFGRLSSNRPRNNPLNPLATFYKSGDGRWFVCNPRGDKDDWEVFCGIAGRSDLITDERFATDRARRLNTKVLVAELDAAFSAMSFEDVAAKLDAADLVWAPVQTPAEVAADPQARASGALVQVEDSEGTQYPSPGAPAQFPGFTLGVRPAAAPVGAHTREVLAEIGYSAVEIDALYAGGAAA